MITRVYRWCGLFCGLLCLACSSPAVRLQTQAEQFGLKRLDSHGGQHAVSLFYRSGRISGQALHVYLEGDGQPWERGYWPAADPTTRSSLMLPLLAMDAAPSLYLGRPCYNGHAADADCHPGLWTHARYSEEVVDSMQTALHDFCIRYDYKQIVLIGHSGGGALALLLAERMPQTRLVITLAGNYDIDAWTDYHHYLRLSASLNPARRSLSGVAEWHFLAAEDNVVPPALFLTALQQRSHSLVEVISGVGHHQGWQKIWPNILHRLETLQ